jgi:hypothetical protein
MILASHGLIASQIASFDADAVAFFGRVTTAGGSLSATEKAAVNQLVLDLKANSLWTPMKAIYPMVGASAAACAQNLKSSSFTGTFTATGWTFASTGATPNGTSAYMDTNFVPSANLTNNNVSFSQYFRTNIADGNIDFGCYSSGTSAIYQQTRYTDNKLYGVIQTEGASEVVYSNLNSQGFYTLNRTSSSSLKSFKNGVLSGNKTNLITGTLPSISYYLSSLNISPLPILFSNREIALASLGDGLTDQNASDFYTAVQAFQTTLSRNV